MSFVKKICIVVFALVFGVIFTMAVSFAVSQQGEEAILTDLSAENSGFDAAGVRSIQLTVELGRVYITAGESDQITVECRYPAEDFLDNQVKVTADRDGETLDIRVSSKRRAYFFGLIKDKACDITVGIPQALLPALDIELKAGTLTVDGPALKTLSIDGDVAEIELKSFGEKPPEKVTVNNNVGNITAYLDNLPGKTLTDFQASVNIGVVDLHMRMDDTRGYQLEYAYNIGRLERKGGQEAGLGKRAVYTVGEEQQAYYRVKTDVGEIRVSEDRGYTEQAVL